MTVALEPITHAEREAAALSNWQAAVNRQDRGEARRLWKEYARVHAERPSAVVAHMEREKGLT